MWPSILKNKVEISFAIPSFKWANNAKHVAGVYCSIIGISNISSTPKFIVTEGFKRQVKHINCYLTAGRDVFVKKRSKPISILPEMNFGSMPNDGGNLLLVEEEKNKLLIEYPKSKLLIKKMIN